MKLFSSRWLSALALSLGTLASAHAAADTWKVDPAHSSISFGVRHFVTKVPGSFGKFDVTLVFDKDNPSASSAEAKIDIASVTTNDVKRDAHLQKDDFFSADKFPAITFKSTSWKKTGEDAYDIVGDLTIKGVTKPVTLAEKFLGTAPGRGGKTLSGWEATTKIDRTDFGVSYGPGVVGNTVDITINLEASK